MLFLYSWIECGTKQGGKTYSKTQKLTRMSSSSCPRKRRKPSKLDWGQLIWASTQVPQVRSGMDMITKYILSTSSALPFYNITRCPPFKSLRKQRISSVVSPLRARSNNIMYFIRRLIYLPKLAYTASKKQSLPMLPGLGIKGAVSVSTWVWLGSWHEICVGLVLYHVGHGLLVDP